LIKKGQKLNERLFVYALLFEVIFQRSMATVFIMVIVVMNALR